MTGSFLFYAGKRPQRDKVNERLLCIQPPHCITRLPRRVEDRIHWKASEWKQWLLYYAIPCTEGVVPLDQWRHFMKLSEAVHILLRESLSARAIDRAGNFLHTVKCVWEGYRELKVGLKEKSVTIHDIAPSPSPRNFLSQGWGGGLWGYSLLIIK